jgi:ribosomal protein S27E
MRRQEKKYFKCSKCKQLQSQAIHRNQFQVKCSSCGSFLNEISENEFNVLQRVTRNRNENNKNNNDSPIMPPEDVFRNASHLYNRPPSNSRNNEEYQEENRNRFNNINDGRRRRNRRYRDFNYNQNHDNEANNRRNNYRRYHSSNHYTDMNIANDSIDNNINNYNNINNEYGNNEAQERERNYQLWPNFGARNRERSLDPNNSPFSNNFFNNFFRAPLIIIDSHPVNHRQNENPHLRIIVQRQNVPQFIFDPMFLIFGSMFNDNFRNNYSSNFRSNFRGNFLNEILRILQRNQDEAARRAHPPTSESALKKLKRFPLSDKYCKKDKNGKIELPSCCICLNDIQKDEETVLLPCGHMFHWNCCLNWLKNNNTCPMCRFELKD